MFGADSYIHHFRLAQRALAKGDHATACSEFEAAARDLYSLAGNATDPLRRKSWINQAQRLRRLCEKFSKHGTFPLTTLETLSRVDPGSDSQEQPEVDLSEKNQETRWRVTHKPQVFFSDIAGLDGVKNVIRQRILEPMKHPDLAKKYKRRSNTGILMYGPPGTGKTLLARAVATELDVPFYSVLSSEIMSKWVGEAEQNLRDLFDTVRKNSPAVLFFDETEALLGKRGSDSAVMNRVVPEFLAQIDGITGSCEGLLLLGATNRPWDVDEAARRPGRFGEIIFIPLPDTPAREFMLRKQLDAIPGADKLDYAWMAEKTQGFSGADINGLVDRIIDPVFERAHTSGTIVPVERGDVEMALAVTRPSVTAADLQRYFQFGNSGVTVK